MNDDDLAAMIARDEKAGDGFASPDVLVWQDRHLLIEEVLRLRQLLDRAVSGRPTSKGHL